MPGLSSIPVMQLRDGYILVYYEQLFTRGWSNKFQNRMQLIKVKEKAYSGDITQGARKRMAKAVTLMSQIVKPVWMINPVNNRPTPHRFSFVTLTVASGQLLTAREGYDLLLQHFLQWLRRTKNVELYVWKAEFQKRGQLHYHLVFPDWIHYAEIRAKWNELQKKAGLLDEYAKKYGHFNPNSTDIHETKGVHNMKAYIMKEMGKSANANKLRAMAMADSLIKAGELPEEKRKATVEDYTESLVMDGKVWGCSTCLSAAKYFTVGFTSRHEDFVREACAGKKARMKSDPFYSMIFFKDSGTSPPGLLNEFEQMDFERHLAAITCPPAPVEPAPFVGWQRQPRWEQTEISLN
jgi:hypothetical protein